MRIEKAVRLLIAGSMATSLVGDRYVSPFDQHLRKENQPEGLQLTQQQVEELGLPSFSKSSPPTSGWSTSVADGGDTVLDEESRILKNTCPSPVRVCPNYPAPEIQSLPTQGKASEYTIGEIDLSKRESISLTFEIPNGEQITKLTTSFQPVVRPDDLEKINSYFEETKPGENTFGVFKDDFGNLVLTGHSGYNPENCPSIEKCQIYEFERLRNFLQGRRPIKVWEQTLPREDLPGTIEDQPGHAELLLGASVVIVRGEHRIILDPVALGKIPHDLMNEFINDTGRILKLVRNLDESENPAFDQFKTQPGILIVFSGWREPEGSDWFRSSEGETPWYSHFAYVVGLRESSQK